jgi:integrase
MADQALADLYNALEIDLKPLADARDRMAAAAYFQLQTACRVREMITISAGQVISPTVVFLVASKNSNSRYVTVVSAQYFLQKSINNGTGPFTPIDYHQYSEWLRNRGINYKLDISLRRSPTHILRYAKLHRLSIDGATHEEVQEFAGHKSGRTTSDYLDAKLV